MEKLRSFVKVDNSLVLPGKLISWDVEGKGEILPLAASKLLLDNVFLPNLVPNPLEEKKQHENGFINNFVEEEKKQENTYIFTDFMGRNDLRNKIISVTISGAIKLLTA